MTSRLIWRHESAIPATAGLLVLPAVNVQAIASDMLAMLTWCKCVTCYITGAYTVMKVTATHNNCVYCKVV